MIILLMVGKYIMVIKVKRKIFVVAHMNVLPGKSLEKRMRIFGKPEYEHNNFFVLHIVLYMI